MSSRRANEKSAGLKRASSRLTLRSGCLLAAVCLTGCWGRAPDAGDRGWDGNQPLDRTVVVYSALDREFAEPVLRDLTREADLVLRAKFDVESTKTVGLTNLIIAEAASPRCDLFWNNEILANTDGVIVVIQAACELRAAARPPPQPSPALRAGEGV